MASDSEHLRVDVRPTGFRVRIDGEQDRVFNWDDIRSIRAYKWNLFAYDLICLGFETDTGSVEISEEDDGYQELQQALETKFPSAVGYHMKVAVPAFETNEMIIFERP